MKDKSETKSTQEFVIFHAICQHTGKVLTPELVRVLKNELLFEITDGPCAWAFNQPKSDNL